MVMRWVAVLWLCGGCRQIYVGDPITSSIQSRVQGGCFSQCSAGWRCDEKTGYCAEIPIAAENSKFPMPLTGRKDAGT